MRDREPPTGNLAGLEHWMDAHPVLYGVIAALVVGAWIVEDLITHWPWWVIILVTICSIGSLSARWWMGPLHRARFGPRGGESKSTWRPEGTTSDVGDGSQTRPNAEKAHSPSESG
jgi:hypothetical protein